MTFGTEVRKRQVRDWITSAPLRKRFLAAVSIETLMPLLLKDPGKFVVTSQGKFVSAVRGGVDAVRVGTWLAYMDERYGWK